MIIQLALLFFSMSFIIIVLLCMLRIQYSYISFLERQSASKLGTIRYLEEKNLKLLLEIKSLVTPVPKASVLELYSDINDDGVLWRVDKMTLRLGKKRVIVLAPKDAGGNAAKVDGVPQWSVSDASLLSVSPAADGMSAEVHALGPLGLGKVSVSADADLGPGVSDIVGEVEIEAVAGDAVMLSLSVGDEVDDVPAPAPADPAPVDASQP